MMLAVSAACVPLPPAPAPMTQPAPIATAALTPAVSATAPGQSAGAQGADSPARAYEAYFAAMRDNDFAQAVQWVSEYSLQAEGWTRQGLRDDLIGAWFGALKFQDLQINGVRMLDERTAIIHDKISFVQGRVPEPTVKEQWNTARLENGRWFVNAGDLVDLAQVDLPAQTINGVTVRLVTIRRYATRTRLVFQVQNGNERVAWWGGRGAPVLTWQRGEQVAKAGQTALRFDPQQSYPTITVETTGFSDGYPERVDLGAWSLSPTTAATAPDPQAGSWTYSFVLPKVSVP